MLSHIFTLNHVTHSSDYHPTLPIILHVLLVHTSKLSKYLSTAKALIRTEQEIFLLLK